MADPVWAAWLISCSPSIYRLYRHCEGHKTNNARRCGVRAGVEGLYMMTMQKRMCKRNYTIPKKGYFFNLH